MAESAVWCGRLLLHPLPSWPEADAILLVDDRVSSAVMEMRWRSSDEAGVDALEKKVRRTGNAGASGGAKPGDL